MRRSLVAGRDRAPLLEPCPEALNPVAVSIGPVRAGYGCLLALGRDSQEGSDAPDALAKGVAGVTPVRHDPAGAPGNWSSKGAAWGNSCACSGATRKATARPAPSAITQCLVPKPPRDSPKPLTVSTACVRSPVSTLPPPWRAPELRPHRGTPSRVRHRVLAPSRAGDPPRQVLPSG